MRDRKRKKDRMKDVETEKKIGQEVRVALDNIGQSVT